MTPSLLDMPNNILKLIAENTNFIAIQNLRKVCHDLRNFIDDIKPTVPITYLAVAVSGDVIKAYYGDGKETRDLVYQKEQIRVLGPRKIVKTLVGNGSSGFLRDLDLILKTVRKTVILEELTIRRGVNEESEGTLEKILDLIKNHLLSRPLRVKLLTLKLQKGPQILGILKNLEPETLRTIIIYDARLYSDEFNSVNRLETREILETEQWKQARELKMKYFVSEPVDKFLHFDKADFSRWGTTVRDLVKIKETAQQSPTFNVFSMSLAGFEEEEEMIDTFGDEYAEDDDSLAWFFRTPNPEKALVLFYYTEQQMIKIATLAMKTVTDSNLSLSD